MYILLSIKFSKPKRVVPNLGNILKVKKSKSLLSPKIEGEELVRQKGFPSKFRENLKELDFSYKTFKKLKQKVYYWINRYIAIVLIT